MALTVQEILQLVSGRLVNADSIGERQRILKISMAAPLSSAKEGDVAFFFSKEYQNELVTARPGVLITAEPFVLPLEKSGLPLWKTSAIVACANPYLALALLSEKIAMGTSTVVHAPKIAPTEVARIHPNAVVHPTARLGRGIEIGPFCTIEEGATIGDGTVLYPGCFVGPRVTIGKNCVLFPKVTLYEWTQIGDRARLHAGVVLGADGFGYAPLFDSAGNPVGHQKIYHLGRVVVGDDVEIGANSLVDRSTFGDTIIGNKVKIDNHCHLGHNSRVDEGAIICGAACLAGSASVGKYAYLGGMCGVSNRVHVGERARVGGMTLVSKDVPPGGTAVGNPQREQYEHFRVHALLNKLMDGKRAKGRKPKDD